MIKEQIVRIETDGNETKAEVVGEVVRCKDCKHNSLKRLSGNAFCDLGIDLYQLYDFCSHGERKETKDAEIY